MFRIAVTEGTGSPTVEIFGADEVLVGRVKGNDIVLPTGNVSKRHARIAFEGGQLFIFDLRSTNGTSVNGHKITAPTPLTNTDAIHIGEFKLEILSATPSTPLADLRDVTALVAMSSPEAAIESAGALAQVAQEPTAAMAAYALVGEQVALTDQELAPVRASSSSPSVPIVSPLPAPPLGAAPPADRPKPQSTSAEIGRLALTTQVAHADSGSANRTPAPIEARPERDASTRRPDSKDVTARRLSVPREPFWDDVRFQRSWQAAIERLTEEVPVEALPSGLHFQTQQLRTFEELSARIVMGLPESKPLSHAHMAALSSIVAHSAVGLGPIDSYLQDPRVRALVLTDDGRVELQLVTGGVSETRPAPLDFTHRPMAQRIRERLLSASAQEGLDGFQVVSASARTGSGPAYVRLQRINAVSLQQNLLPASVVERIREILGRNGAILMVIPESQRGTWGAVRPVLDALDTSRNAWVASDLGALELKRPAIGTSELAALRWCPVPVVLDVSNPAGWAAWLRASTHVSIATVAMVHADSIQRALARACLLTEARDIGTVSALFDGVLHVVEEAGTLSAVTFEEGAVLQPRQRRATGDEH